MTAEQLAERRANGQPFSMIERIAGATAATQQQSAYLVAILDTLVRIEGLLAALNSTSNNRSEK